MNINVDCMIRLKSADGYHFLKRIVRVLLIQNEIFRGHIIHRMHQDHH